MSNGPSFTSRNNTVTFDFPADWNVTASATSRQRYHHLMIVKDGLASQGSLTARGPDIFNKPLWNAANDKLRNILTGSQEYFKPDGQAGSQSQITADFHYSATKLPSSSEVRTLKTNKYASNKVEVFVEICVGDSPNPRRVQGRYNDLVAIFEFNKANPNSKPPPPPPNTNAGYNPVLDLPRPSTIQNYLADYDTVFLIDDSGSMAEANKWTELNTALIGISSTAISFDADGIDLFFLNSDAKFSFRDVKGVMNVSMVSDAMRRVSPNGGTPTGKRIKERMEAFLGVLDSAQRASQQDYTKVKPLDLICITDGVPDNATELESVLVDLSYQYRAKRHHPNWMGIQFVQIGDDDGAKAALERLTALDTGSMVDTVPYDGPGSLTPAKMERILLGGLHPNIRALGP